MRNHLIVNWSIKSRDRLNAVAHLTPDWNCSDSMQGQQRRMVKGKWIKGHHEKGIALPVRRLSNGHQEDENISPLSFPIQCAKSLQWSGQEIGIICGHHRLTRHHYKVIINSPFRAIRILLFSRLSQVKKGCLDRHDWSNQDTNNTETGWPFFVHGGSPLKNVFPAIN